MSIPSSIAFSVGDGFEPNLPFEERAKAVVSVLLKIGIIGSDVPTKSFPDSSGIFPIGEKLAEHGDLFLGVSVVYQKGGKPFPILVDTQGDPYQFPKATILIVIHDFFPAGYDRFISEISRAFGGHVEDYVVVF